ncbi:exosome complex exonuclease RRP43 [Pseudomassariella vexata]|uniref:Ribosomal RNA-processing protein 43 n=1 Tax=Pseudomassariella vexata TaxID=1141098 RepID=A0A1Y2E868_9PEZI|nr:exosome complex exonuclease RRP43 [Pseudomassariella vexata]ORY67627.1 exosome complex exonuclease RRP43 [Pseudomassariella vexata]
MATSSSLTLSSATFAKLSPHPYLLANLQPADASVPSSRTNGRQPQQARSPNINTSSLSHAHGSAVVRTGDTTVICGVRGETLLTTAIPNYRAPDASSMAAVNEVRDYDLLVPNIELATGCAPNFLPGVPPTTLAQTLSTRVYSLLQSSKLVDVDRLRIYQQTDFGNKSKDEEEDEGEKNKGDEKHEEEADEDLSAEKVVKAYWVLYIDVLFISFDGNPFDAAWAAVLAALRDTKLPEAYWDIDQELVLCRRTKTPSPLTLQGFPVACTAAVFTAKEKQRKGSDQYWILADPDRLEESLCDETVSMVIDKSSGTTKVLGISKSGGVVVGPRLMRDIAALANVRWDQFHSAMK